MATGKDEPAAIYLGPSNPEDRPAPWSEEQTARHIGHTELWIEAWDKGRAIAKRITGVDVGGVLGWERPRATSREEDARITQALRICFQCAVEINNTANHKAIEAAGQAVVARAAADEWPGPGWIARTDIYRDDPRWTKSGRHPTNVQLKRWFDGEGCPTKRSGCRVAYPEVWVWRHFNEWNP